MTPDQQPLTKQDLREALDHTAEAIRAEMRTSQESMRAELRTSLDRAVESIAGDFSELREALTNRMDTLERRFDNQLPIILSIDQRLAALTRQSDRLERDNGGVLSNQAAQQRAFRPARRARPAH